MNLVLEPGINQDYERALVDAARKLGWDVVLVQHVPFSDTFVVSLGDGTHGQPVSGKVLQDKRSWFYGSIQAAKIAQKATAWTVHATWSQLRCAAYYPHLRSRLFQKNWKMTTVERVLLNRDALYASDMAIDQTLFFRPDGCDKLFTGMCISLPEFDQGYQMMTFYDVPPYTPVVVASPQKILEEARFLVVNKKVVTGSLYKNDGRSEHVPASPKLLAIAQETLEFCIAQGYNPALSWVLDLAFDGAEWRILEVGATSCCGLYKCDPYKLLAALDASLSPDAGSP